MPPRIETKGLPKECIEKLRPHLASCTFDPGVIGATREWWERAQRSGCIQLGALAQHLGRVDLEDNKDTVNQATLTSLHPATDTAVFTIEGEFTVLCVDAQLETIIEDCLGSEIREHHRRRARNAPPRNTNRTPSKTRRRKR